MKRGFISLLITLILLSSVPLSARASAPARRIYPLPEHIIDSSALIDGVSWHAYIKDLTRSKVILTLNADQSMHPASMIQVPLAILLLEHVQAKGRTIPGMQTKGFDGGTYDQLIASMVVASEEGAAGLVEKFIQEDSKNFNLLQQWGLTHASLKPRRSTSRELGLIKEKLYQGELLN